MKTYRIETKEEKIVDKVYCDKCGTEINPGPNSIYNYNWFKFSTGIGYSDGSVSGTEFSMQLCESCSVALLMSLDNLGYKIQTKEIDM